MDWSESPTTVSSAGGIPEKYVTPTFMPVLALQTVFAYRTDAFTGKAAQVLRSLVWREVDAVVMTSATLAAGHDFRAFAAENGIPSHAEMVSLDSPFDLQRQAQNMLRDGGEPGVAFRETQARALFRAGRLDEALAELVVAGIDVATTLNIQHIESLNDIVAGFTSPLGRYM